MRILVLSNLFPPHHAGTEDYRCQGIVDGLKQRGHETFVLCSIHGMKNERIDGEVSRRLLLNGAFGHPLVTAMGELKPIELHNHAVARETVAQFKPDLIHVFSLHGLSKSLIFTLQQSNLPLVYDVADTWLAEDLKDDPWLRWWNHSGSNSLRALQEFTGRRKKLDALAPTRLQPGWISRLPEVFGDGKSSPSPPPDSISVFHLTSIYFCSQALKEATQSAGFRVSHGEVIPPGIATQMYVGEVKPASTPLQKLLLVGRLNKASGLMTAMKAIQIARTTQPKISLSVYGRGDSNSIAEARSLVALQRLPIEFLPVSNTQRDLASLFRQHDALLHTVEQPEPYCLTPIEAMAAGLPVIGTPLGGARDLFRHGENALTYRPGSAEELAARIQELSTQPELRCKLAETGQAEALSRFSDTAMMDQIENFLEMAQQGWLPTQGGGY